MLIIVFLAAAFIEYEDVRDAEDAVRKLDGGELFICRGVFFGHSK